MPAQAAASTPALAVGCIPGLEVAFTLAPGADFIPARAAVYIPVPRQMTDIKVLGDPASPVPSAKNGQRSTAPPDQAQAAARRSRLAPIKLHGNRLAL
jgi:hypothetical protein